MRDPIHPIPDVLPKPLRVLILEDVARDADLEIRELKRAGIPCEVRVTDSREGMREALDNFAPDIVLSDYRMPQFDGIEALEIRNRQAPHLPFLVVTASVDEQTAVDCLKNGADDYLIKDRLVTLPHAVRNAVQKKRLERLARESAEQTARAAKEWRATFDAMRDAVALLDADLKILRCNRAMQELLGHPRERIDGSSALEVMGPSVWGLEPGQESPADCPIRRAKEALTRGTKQTFANGRWLELIADPVLDADGCLAGIVHIVVDITERKGAEEAMRDADRRKDRFLATLAHELRNPLAPIRNAVDILKLKGTDDPAVQAVHGMIDRQLEHMVRLIDDLLDAGRIAQGKLKLRLERLELKNVLDQVLEALAPQVERAGLRMVLSQPPGSIPLDADPVRLAQVFHNLLDNACKFTERGGQIRLAAERDGSVAVVRIADTGIGIAPEHLNRIFEMFSQVGTRSEHVPGGLGIGLSLSRALVTLHGGSIQAWSEGPGRGSELIVRLPIPARAEEVEMPNEDPEGTAAARSRRILVVDDNRDVVESLAMLLSLTGNRVETASNGLVAVEMAERFRPEVVLLDLGMPVLDGYGACRQIRAQGWGRAMRIVALSGWGKDDDRERTREAGFDDHLVKPVEASALLRALAES